jgi:TolB-like protein/predicted ATPase
MSGDPDQEHFADGLTEDIITALSKLRGLHVIGRNSTFVYKGKSIPIKQAGAELGARYILEGSVRKSGDRLRVTGQLVEAATDQHLWAERYDPDLKDIFAIQDEITERVVNAVEPAVRAWEQRHGTSGLCEGLERDEASPTQRTAAERRQLTIMSCELLGTAALAARMELEDLRDVTGAYHRWIADTIARFGGYIGERGGSGVLAYFGYPAAHEDDAEQAVRAGLELCASVRAFRPSADAALRCRIGIATGLVIVGDRADVDRARDEGIAGEAPGLAAQLQSLAQPDAVVIEQRTKRLIGNLFDCRDLGEIDGSGTTEPIRVWQVTGTGVVESRFEALHSGGLTPLVGRDEELEMLQRRWQQAAQGEGRVVLIAGEPGIGKSRIALALQESLRPDTHIRLRYFCSPHHTDSAFFPFVRQLEHAARFERDDSPSQKLAKLEAILAQSAADAESVTLLASLLSLPGDNRTKLLELTPQRRKEKTLATFLAQLGGLAARQPVLVIFEDLHWIDPTSLELLTLTVERAQLLPVLVVMTFRPEFGPPWVGQPNVTSLVLNRLTTRDGANLVQQVAGHNTLPRKIVDEIVERTDGVPLFVEELTKSVVETGAGEAERAAGSVPSAALAVPATLHASLMARLDRLGSAKQVAQIGAAIGREFSYELIAAVSRQNESELAHALDRLLDSGLLFRRSGPPQPTFLFKHALVQDTAYGTLLRHARQDLHARIANTLIERFADITETQPEILAHHYTKAGLIAQAAIFWGKAGQKSITRSALVEAVAQLARALQQIASLPSTPSLRQEQIKLQLALATALMHVKGYASPETGAAFEQAAEMIDRAEAACELSEDPLIRLSAIYGLWTVNYVSIKADTLLPLANQFLARAQQLNSSGSLVVGHRLLGASSLILGQFDAARDHLDRALALYAPEQHRPLTGQFVHDIGAMVLANRSWVLWLLGYPAMAQSDIEALLRNARDLGQAATLMFALFHVAIPEILFGKFAAAEAHAQELITIAEEKGAMLWRAFGVLFHGWTLSLASGDPEAAEIISTGFGDWEVTGARLFRPIFLSALARAQTALGQFDRASNCMSQALGLVGATNERWAEAEIHRTAGELMLASGDPPKKAEAHFRRSLTVARKQKAKSWELKTATSLARLWRDQGRPDEARELVAPIYGCFTEGFDTADLQAAEALLAQLDAR